VTGEPATAPSAEVSLSFVGDIIVGHYHSRGYARHHRGDHAPLAAVAPLLAADLSIANLETPLVATLPQHSPVHSKYRFGAGKDAIRILKQAGIGAVSLANNHAADLREDGLRQTPHLLREEGITPLGEARVPAAGSPFVVHTVAVRGLRLGIVAATTQQNVPLAAKPTTPRLPVCDTALLPRHLAPPLREARADHDLLIVLLHWGTQFTEQPSPTQRRVAHALIEAGADLVIGHHPHVLQGIERYRRGLIAYSLGNFLFPDALGAPRLTGVLRVDIRRKPLAIARATFLPAVARVYAGHAVAPQPALGRAGAEVLSRMHRVCRPLGTRLLPKPDRVELTFPVEENAVSEGRRQAAPPAGGQAEIGAATRGG
jgi:poly-gamma-glutamate synthesis protein (capsule biosynthesis protein)